MPLDTDKLRMVTEKSETLSKRFDEFIERKKINDAAEGEDEDEDEEIEEELREPAEEALRNSPGSELANPEINNEEPWFS